MHVGVPSFSPGRMAKILPRELDTRFQSTEANSIPISSTLTSHPSDFVVSTNQSLACLSESVSARRDMPVSVSPLSTY